MLEMAEYLHLILPLMALKGLVKVPVVLCRCLDRNWLASRQSECGHRQFYSAYLGRRSFVLVIRAVAKFPKRNQE